MGGWLGLALTSANRRISADFLHHFFLLFLLSFHASLLAQAIFLIVKRRKVCMSPVMWRDLQPLCRNFTCGVPLLCKRQTCYWILSFNFVSLLNYLCETNPVYALHPSRINFENYRLICAWIVKVAIFLQYL